MSVAVPLPAEDGVIVMGVLSEFAVVIELPINCISQSENKSSYVERGVGLSNCMITR